MPIETPGGTFDAQLAVYQNSVLAGAGITLTFTPKGHTQASEQPIGLIQTTQIARTGLSLADQYEDEPLKLARMTADGTHIDQSTYVTADGETVSENDAHKLFETGTNLPVPQTNPVYIATNAVDSYARKLTDNVAKNAFGNIYRPDGSDPAKLIDHPHRVIFANETIVHLFETAAVTLVSPYRYLGSVRWGYKAVAAADAKQAVITLQQLAKLSDDRPTLAFLEAAQKWNEQKIVDYYNREKIARVQIPIP